MNALLKIGDIKLFGKFNMVGAVYDYDSSRKSYKVVGLNGSIYSIPYDVSPIKSVKLNTEIRTKLRNLALMKARIIECVNLKRVAKFLSFSQSKQYIE